MCDADECTLCDDGYGANASDNGCTACTSELTGMATCTSALNVAATCDSGYGLISDVCTACTVTNCSDCSSADVCTMCNSGYGISETGDACSACADGCAECSSNCMRSCTACAGEGRTAPNCGCADDETWNSATSTCDGEAEAESEPDTSSGNTSANILKFAAMVLLALLALL